MYQGTWRVTTQSAAAGAKPDALINHCAETGRFFACEQNVNGAATGLLVLVPGSRTGSYYTQTINAEGRAQGRGELTLGGSQWIFTSRWDQGGGRTTFYKTTNTFLGKDRIHFEQAESADNTTWVVKNSGDEIRVAAH
jgi:hypothetical protein